MPSHIDKMLHIVENCIDLVAGEANNVHTNETIRFMFEASWQPFLVNHVPPREKYARVCGVLVEILREYSRKWNVSLTYVVYNDTDGVPYDSFREDRIDLLLKPFPPMGWNFTRMSGHILPSRVVSDISMLTMLSAIEQPQTFNSGRFLAILDVPFVYIYFAFHLFVHSMFLFFFRKIYLKESVGSNLLRFTFRQTGSNFRRQQSTSILLLNFLWLSIFFQFFVSNIFLDLATLQAPVKGLIRLEDLYHREDVTAIVYQGETAENILQEMQASKLFTGRILTVTNLDYQVNEKIELLGFVKQIMTGSYVLLSDEYYLDYVCSQFMDTFPRLFRPKMKRMTLPFFLLGSRRFMKRNQPKLDFILRQLLESGTQAKWLSEYLRRANMAMKHNSEVSAVGKKKIRMGAVSFQALMLQDLKVLFHLFVLVNLGTAFVVIAEILSMKFA